MIVCGYAALYHITYIVLLRLCLAAIIRIVNWIGWAIA